MTLKIECSKQDVLDHITYFLNALPKNDVKVEVLGDDVMTSKNKRQYQKAIKALKKGDVIDSVEARKILGV